MSGVSHTPGSWEIKPEEVSRDYIRVRGSIPGRLYKIANVICEHPTNTKESRKNALLIASAPEMLEALQSCKDDLDLYLGLAKDNGRPNSELDRISKRVIATIDKATGKEPS